jgi:hypothetical protein
VVSFDISLVQVVSSVKNSIWGSVDEGKGDDAGRLRCGAVRFFRGFNPFWDPKYVIANLKKKSGHLLITSKKEN